MIKRLIFEKEDNTNYFVLDKRKETLGIIFWYPKWKQWVFEQNHGIIMSWDCLQEIVNFIKELK